MKNTLKNTLKLSTAGLLLLTLPTYANENHCNNADIEVGYKHCDSQVGWYIGGQLGFAQSDIKGSGINALYDEASSLHIDDSDLAFSLMVGYQLNTYWAIEGAYIDLGERSVDFSGSTEDLASFYDNVEHVYPQSGDGLSVAVVGSWPLSENLKLSGKLGYWRWEGDYTTFDVNGTQGKDSIKGNDLWFGAELNYRLTERTQVYLTAQRLSLDRDDNNVFGLGVRYYFGDEGQTQAKSAIRESSQAVLTETVPVQTAVVQTAPVQEIVAVVEQVIEQELIDVLPLPDDFSVYFATGKDTLNQAALTQLTQLDILLAQRDDLNISLNGYASKTGNNTFNKQLSQWRTHNVQKQLYLAGIDLSRITIVFFGDDEQSDRVKAQRVDISFSYSGGKQLIASGPVIINFGLFSNKLSKSDIAKLTTAVAEDMNDLEHIELISYEKSPGNTYGLIELAASRANKVKAVLVEQGISVPVLINYLFLNDDEQAKDRKVDVIFFSQSK
jgi:outer membrane protein OmpA-like peptidoglycan-associated protein